MIWFLVLSSLATQAMAQNFSCNTGDMDWYSQTIGETPCATYSRLRQICNPSYNISSLQSIFGSTPDYCTDEPADCCCNSASFVLSMLCRNCQFESGHKAFTGAYDVYLNKSGSTCSPNTNGRVASPIISRPLYVTMISRSWMQSILITRQMDHGTMSPRPKSLLKN
ncbi:hypothetical protein CPB85DRAFT_481752 [Mucidula mucida]|nr:hypothetical protein CPB85DRAFT_481752 [Mucidula mucida]